MASLRTTFLSVTLWTCTFYQYSVYAMEAVGQVSRDDALAMDIDNFVLNVMKCHQSPALTLAIVKDGKMLLTKGYGYTSTNMSQPATSKTKFAIASLTKAFTATLVAKWVHEQKDVTMDTPIKTFYPQFQVADEHRTAEATFRDLLSHRMGIPAYFKPLMMGFPLDVSRDELVKRMTYIPSPISFRSKFVYNNYMYLMAAHVIEKMSGNKTWEELTRNSILAPLNMSNTGFFNHVDELSDLALPCAFINDTLVDLPKELFTAVVPCGPAGSIYSNAEDMAKWIQFLLLKGVGPNGEKIVEPEVIKMTFEPGIIPELSFEELIRPEFPVSHIELSYDLGWLTANYRGYRQIFHTGGFVTHSSRLWLYPDIKAGIYVNVNGPQLGGQKKDLLESLMYFISDLLLNEAPWNQTDWCQANAKPDTTQSPNREATQSVDDSRLIDTSSDQNQTTFLGDEQDFVGNYTHKCFGTIEITWNHEVEPSRLMFQLGRYGRLDLHRHASLVFHGTYFGPLSYLDSIEEVNFTRNSKDMIDNLFYSLDDASDPIQFERQTNEKSQGNNKQNGNTASSCKTTILWTTIIFSIFPVFTRL